jgi:hypothetical protein
VLPSTRRRVDGTSVDGYKITEVTRISSHDTYDKKLGDDRRLIAPECRCLLVLALDSTVALHRANRGGDVVVAAMILGMVQIVASPAEATLIHTTNGKCLACGSAGGLVFADQVPSEHHDHEGPGQRADLLSFHRRIVARST